MVELFPGLPAVFTVGEALGAGFTTQEIRRRLARGEWVMVRTGVYTTADVLTRAGADDRLRHGLDVMAAQRTIGASTWASHESAARLFGLPVPGTGREMVRLTAPAGGKFRRVPAHPGLPPPVRLPRRVRLPQPGVEIHPAAVPAHHQTVVDGVPATTVPRAVVDLARHLPLAEAVAVGDAAVRLRLTTREQLYRVIADCRRWPRLGRARAAVNHIDGRRESVLESRSFVMFVAQQLPLPESQVWIEDDTGLPFARVDFLWREAGVVGEADGQLKYAGAADQRVLWEEKRRQERLEDLGLVVVRWGWADVEKRPAQTANRIRRAFARAAMIRTATLPT